MYIAKWSWKTEWKVFLVDVVDIEDIYGLEEATNIARCYVGLAGDLVVERVEFGKVKSGMTPGGMVPGIAPIISSEDL